MILKIMYLLATCMLAAAQITSALEFKASSVFQKDRAAAAVDGTSYSSAEKTHIDADVLMMLKQLEGNEGGTPLIESRMMPEAETRFRQRKLPIAATIAHYRLASLYRVTGQTEMARTHMAEFQKLQSKEKWPS